jgi:hypothetical protein
MIFEWALDFYNALTIAPQDQLSGMTIYICVFVIVLGGLGCLLGALIVWGGVRKMTPKKWKSRTAFWGVFSVLFVWVLWTLFVPSVNFKMESISPDGGRKLILEDITGDLLYEEIGWRLKARLEDARTGHCLGKMIIRHWHSGFDDFPSDPPTPEDVRVRWSKDGRSALVEFGWFCGILPECTTPERSPYAPEIVERFQIPVKQ